MGLKKDRDFVMEVVKLSGYELQYASVEFKKDREIVLEAVKNDGKTLKYAFEELKKDIKNKRKTINVIFLFKILCSMIIKK